MSTPVKDSRAERVAWVESVARELGTGCRDWPWAVNNKGYGVVRWNGRARKVGHLVLELGGHPRPSPTSMQLHACDRPQCAAPWHLRWGTPTQNRADMDARGRTVLTPGVTNGRAKLTDSDVRSIRAAADRTNLSLAIEFGVHRTVIGKIRRGVIWQHLPLEDPS